MWTHMDGRPCKGIKLYALSTCGWCKKTKDYLNEEGVEYDYVFVDLLEEKEKEKVLDEMQKYVDRLAFPLVMVGETPIQGYKPEEIKSAIDD